MDENTGHLKFVTKNSNPKRQKKKPRKPPNQATCKAFPPRWPAQKERSIFHRITALHQPWLILLLKVTDAHHIGKRAGKQKQRYTCRLSLQCKKILLCICIQSLLLLLQVQALQRIPLKYRLLMQPTPPQLQRFTT